MVWKTGKHSEIETLYIVQLYQYYMKILWVFISVNTDGLSNQFA